MDIERRKQLKMHGKAEVERRSAERKAQSEALLPDMLAALSHSGTLPSDPAGLPPDARSRYERERWVVELRPIVHREQLNTEFVPLPDTAGKWKHHPLGYVMCKGCQSAVPAVPPRCLFYASRCACGNLRWRRWFGQGQLSVQEHSKALPIALFGRANISVDPTDCGMPQSSSHFER
ncbi:MAG: hypothetical protein C4K60_06475 [Ideonella sp. MAG2]|nr:MAG: hypothetical protein C4K60_06475 [Ideonella sp. MAG2]